MHEHSRCRAVRQPGRSGKHDAAGIDLELALRSHGPQHLPGELRCPRVVTLRAMTYCSNCGVEAAGNFCWSCGARLAHPDSGPAGHDQAAAPPPTDDLTRLLE